ncbi:unnamed protein product [Schistosoma margrebowiei]|uniref:Uncharacterized protein n=1 Tax=Schistosoma margrebowiei TaxID=48269 RepID=A0A183N2U9_9TREM|nr:unnamed protein product [Schistosoma margrebowiei]
MKIKTYFTPFICKHKVGIHVFFTELFCNRQAYASIFFINTPFHRIS